MPEAVLRYEDKEIALPTEVGSEGEIAIDIGRLRAETGLITVDRGFANTAETRSAVSYIDGEKGILRYRGYPIEQIADQCSFLEVAYLLQYGELPTKDELEAYEESITRHTLLREDMKHLFEAFPHDAHPMQILASATSALATYYPDALDPRDEEAIDISSRRLIAKTPTMVAWSYKYRIGQPYVYPRHPRPGRSAPRRCQPGGARDAGGHRLLGRRRLEDGRPSEGQERSLPPHGIRSPGLQELRSPGPAHQEDRRGRPQGARPPRSAPLRGDGAGAGGSLRRLLRRAPPLPQRRLLQIGRASCRERV